jgi:hypothetical protein
MQKVEGEWLENSGIVQPNAADIKEAFVWQDPLSPHTPLTSFDTLSVDQNGSGPA